MIFDLTIEGLKGFALIDVLTMALHVQCQWQLVDTQISSKMQVVTTLHRFM